MWPFRSVSDILGANDGRQVLFDLSTRLDRQKHYDNFTKTERIVWHCHVLRREVLNGSIEQYFTNSSGDLLLETIDSLNRISAIHVADLLELSARFFIGEARDLSREQRIHLMEGLSKKNATLYEANVSKFTEEIENGFPEMYERALHYFRRHADDIR